MGVGSAAMRRASKNHFSFKIGQTYDIRMKNHVLRKSLNIKGNFFLMRVSRKCWSNIACYVRIAASLY